MDVALLNALMLAFVGGIILNFMPCVFPILSLKIVAIAKQKAQGKGCILRDCLLYTGGVLCSMLVLSVGMLMFRATGSLLGWGFQLQSPILVAALVYITFLIGLSFSGWYEIPSIMPILGSKGSQNVASFLSGVFSSLIGTPCAAPFMVSAISFSMFQPGVHSVFIFMVMGLGMAFPYIVFSCIPGATSIMPKPGPWMEHLRQFLAFPMYLTSAWLLHVLVSQQGGSSLFLIVSSIILLVFLIWLLRQVSMREVISGSMVTLLTVVSVVGLAFYIGKPHGNHVETGRDSVVEFSAEGLQKLLDDGNTVFVSVGAEWCLTCKANELVINSEKIKEILRSRDVVHMKADWTNMDKEIAKYLGSMGSGSIPFYQLYVKGKPVSEPIPQLLTEGKLAEILNKNLS